MDLPPGLIAALGGDPDRMAAMNGTQRAMAEGVRSATAFAVQQAGLNAGLEELRAGADALVADARERGALPMIMDCWLRVGEVIEATWAKAEEHRAESGCGDDCDGVGCMAHVARSHPIVFFVQISAPLSQWNGLTVETQPILESVVDRARRVLRAARLHEEANGDGGFDWAEEQDSLPEPIERVLRECYGSMPEVLAGNWTRLADGITPDAVTELRAELPNELDALLAKDHLTIDDLFGTS
jgi:hypothetical protein